MAGSTTFPISVDSFQLPISGEALSGPVTAASSVQVGSLGLAIEAIEQYLLAAPVNNIATAGSAATIPDPGTYPMTVVNLSAANCALTFASAVAGKAGMLMIIQDATGGRTVTWPAGMRFPGGVQPVLSTGGGQIDIFSYACFVTHWNLFTAGLGMA